MAKSSNDEMARKPRVHIQYKLETGNATQKIDLPFVMGVLADLSGDQTDEKYKADLDNREMMEVTGGNINGVMKAVNPRISVQVPNKVLEGSKDPFAVDVTFASLADFSPEKLAERIPELAELLKVSRQLKDLEAATSNKGLKVEAVLKQILDEVKSQPVG